MWVIESPQAAALGHSTGNRKAIRPALSLRSKEARKLRSWFQEKEKIPTWVVTKFRAKWFCVAQLDLDYRLLYYYIDRKHPVSLCKKESK